MASVMTPVNVYGAVAAASPAGGTGLPVSAGTANAPPGWVAVLAFFGADVRFSRDSCAAQVVAIILRRRSFCTWACCAQSRKTAAKMMAAVTIG